MPSGRMCQTCKDGVETLPSHGGRMTGGRAKFQLSWRCSASPRLLGCSRVPQSTTWFLYLGGTLDAERLFVRRDAEGPKVMPVVHRDEEAFSCDTAVGSGKTLHEGLSKGIRPRIFS